MATKASTAAAFTQGSFTSLKDAAYQQAGAAQTLESVARYTIEKDAGFPATVSPEAREELYDGYRMKWDALNPSVTYAVINGHYVLPNGDQLTAKNVERIEVGMAFAFSYSSQEFGKLANTQPALHAVIKSVRERCGDYCSNRLGDLKRAATKILSQSLPARQRGANKDFVEFVEAWFKDTAPTRLKSASARGDSTADGKRFNEAKVAFMVKWNA